MGKNKHHSSHRSNSYEEDEREWGCGSWFEYAVVVTLASVLLVGVLALTLFWVFQYHEKIAWSENPEKQFFLHPILMVAGFITFSGFSILLYRICRCCRRLYVKLLHTIFHALAVPCIVVGFIAVLDYHNNSKPPIANFYSLHSWLGFITMGLFAIQFVIGFFSFLVLLCCDNATASFRAGLVPIHAAFGIATFILAIATCLTGLSEKAIFVLGKKYEELTDESIVINAIGVTLITIGILVVVAVRRASRQRCPRVRTDPSAS